MLYLGIDQHKRQLTVNLRGEDGSVILKRQVSTQWEKVRAFFADLAEKARPEGGFLAILEVCGMNPWLLEMLKEYGCRETVVIQPTERSKQKTDRRDARVPLLRQVNFGCHCWLVQQCRGEVKCQDGKAAWASKTGKALSRSWACPRVDFFLLSSLAVADK